MLRLENMKFLKARNAVFLHSGGLLPLYYRFCHSKKTAEEEFVYKNKVQCCLFSGQRS